MGREPRRPPPGVRRAVAPLCAFSRSRVQPLGAPAPTCRPHCDDSHHRRQRRLRRRRERPGGQDRRSFQGCPRWGGQRGRVQHRGGRCCRREAPGPGGNSRRRRRHRPRLAVVLRRRRCPRAALDQSLDRGSDGPEVFTRSPGDFHFGARGLCAVAEGGPRRRHCERRHGA